MDIRIHLCVPEDQKPFLPKRRRAPQYLPKGVPIPRIGELVYLSSSSAWVVLQVVHEWLGPNDLRVEVWLEHFGPARHGRPTGFALTQ